MNKEMDLKSLQAMLDLEEYAIKFDKQMQESYAIQIRERELKISALQKAIKIINENQ